MRQVIIATHSPYLVQLQEKDELLIAVKLMTSGPKGKPTNTLECWPLLGTWRCSEDQPGVGWARILDYLVGPEDVRLKLPPSLLEN